MVVASNASGRYYVDWYFDFISPYSYLALERMPQWPGGVELVPKPILFAGLLNHWGQKGPAEIPVKRTFTYRQTQWIADRAGVPFRFPPRHPFNPVSTLRLCVSLGSDMDAVRSIFRYIWAEGGEVDTAAGWRALAKRLGVEDADARVADPEVKARLRANGEEAIAAGVFGVPSFVVDGLVFWGQDSTAMALDYLTHPEHFETTEMRRLTAIPVGVSRV
jgi:2-hydroxychromene-2-carboxylate isomerase